MSNKTAGVKMHSQATKGKQSLDYTALWQLGAHKLRVKRRRDSYDFQSWARIERWDGSAWQEVATIPYSSMSEDSYYSRESIIRPTPAELQDEDMLLRLADMILGGE